MLDVRQLFIRPSNKPGLLKGAFTLYCAYMRGDVEKAEARGPKPEAGEPKADGTGAAGAAEAGGQTNRLSEPVLEVPEPAAIPPVSADNGVSNGVTEPASAPAGEVQ